VKFRLGSQELEADCDDLSSTKSKHTDVDLRQCEIEFEVLGEQESTAILDRLADKQSLVSLDEEGKPEITWLIGNSSYSYQESPGPDVIYTHRWTLTEKEELVIQSLTVDDLELKPYFYSEEFESELLFVRARVRVNDSELKKLRQLVRQRNYFSVIRNGINTKPCLMRMGQSVWSQDGDAVKYQLLLVDKAYDDISRSPGLFQPDMPRMKMMLAETAEQFLELTSMLVAKGVLTQDDQNKLKDLSENVELRMEEFSRVAELDDWNEE